MRLSIITINYNNKIGLKATIKSVKNQSFTNYEWIVIDGGSTDGSKNLIESCSSLFSYWVSEHDNGIYHAMNKGIAHAKGDWVLFLNSGDCLFNDNVLDDVFSDEYTEDVIYGNRAVEKDGGYEVNRYPETVSLSFFYHYSLCHQSTFYRRTLFEEALYDESYSIAGDWAYFLDLLFKGKSFRHIDVTVALYDNTGISSQYSEKQLREIDRVRTEKIPPHIKPDVEMLEQWRFVEHRRSLQKLYRMFYRILKEIDRLLTKFESKKNG